MCVFVLRRLKSKNVIKDSGVPFHCKLYHCQHEIFVISCWIRYCNKKIAFAIRTLTENK